MGAVIHCRFLVDLARPAATLPNGRVPCRLVYSSRAGVAKHPSPQPCHHHQDHERDRRDGEVTVVVVRPLQLCFQFHS